MLRYKIILALSFTGTFRAHTSGRSIKLTTHLLAPRSENAFSEWCFSMRKNVKIQGTRTYARTAATVAAGIFHSGWTLLYCTKILPLQMVAGAAIFQTKSRQKTGFEMKEKANGRCRSTGNLTVRDSALRLCKECEPGSSLHFPSLYGGKAESRTAVIKCRPYCSWFGKRNPSLRG
jgi:hypothetical protein